MFAVSSNHPKIMYNNKLNEYENFKRINPNQSVQNLPIQMNYNEHKFNSIPNPMPTQPVFRLNTRDPTEQKFDDLKLMRNNDLEVFKELQGGNIIDNKPYYYSKKTF